jgi:Ca2+-binding EF-hand superfamily protein
MSPAQIQAAKQAELRRIEEKLAYEASAARQQSAFFGFADVTWISNRVQRHAIATSGGNVFVEIQPLIEGWLHHRYPKRLRSYDFDLNTLEQAMIRSRVDCNHPVSFLSLLDLICTYQALHLENEIMAGFSEASYKKLKERFAPYDKNGNGLKARELWAVLGDCGVTMSSNEEQLWMIRMVKETDKDFSGTIDLGEFCQLMRLWQVRKEGEQNAREISLIESSKIPVSEAEEWVELYRKFDNGGRNGLTLAQLCQLFNNIGIKWNLEGNSQLISWMKETDENANNRLDFGEFCCLIQKMVAEDFSGIRSATSGKGDRSGAGNSDGGVDDKMRWKAEGRIQLGWNMGNEEPPSPTVAHRATIDFSFQTDEKSSVSCQKFMDQAAENTISAISEVLATSQLEHSAKFAGG